MAFMDDYARLMSLVCWYAQFYLCLLEPQQERQFLGNGIYFSSFCIFKHS